LPGFQGVPGRDHTGREAGVNANWRMCHEVADCGCSSERDIGLGLLPPRHREPRNSAAAEDRAATWTGLGIAEIGAKVGGLIRQGRPLPFVLTTLCQLFDATVKGFSSSVLLLDRTGTRVRNAAGSGLPVSYMKQLAAPAAVPGLRLHEVSPILSLTGEPLGIFAVYQRESDPDVTRCHSALIPQFTQVVALSLSELERNKVMVRTELAGELPRVQGDRVQLQQVILNLLLNASDAMSGVDDRPRRLVIRTERDKEDRVRLSVRDTGVGFGPQGVDRLFDAFYTTKSSGMGIGLSVSRSIIESHKGRLWATPNDGLGATFSFSIPCGPQDVTDRVTGAGSLGGIRTSAVTNAGERQVRSL
jgi:hypothetical protein